MGHRAPCRAGRDEARPSRARVRSGQPCEGPVTPQPATHAAGGAELIAGWAIWVGIAVSTRSTDVRVAQQLSVLGSFPPLIIVALMSLNVITESTALAIGLAAALLAFDLLAWRVVARMFDRERLVTGRPG
jgi:hypothetical protein